MNAVRLEVRKPVSGFFLLDTSQIDGPDLLATDLDAGTEWVAVECNATNITVKRGGSRDGIATKTEVGTLNVTFLDGVNPLDDPRLRPGMPVRLVEATTGTPLFTGKIDGFSVAYDKMSDHSYITMRCFDGVTDLAATKRAGADGPETWQDRVTRILETSPVPYVAPDPYPGGSGKWDLILEDAGTVNNGWSGDVQPFGGGYGSIWYSNPSGIPSTRTLTGLTPGKTYWVDVWLSCLTSDAASLNCTIDANSYDSDIRTFSDETYLRAEYWFVADSDVVTLTASGPAGTDFGFNLVSLSELVPSLWAAPIVHDTDLASHLDIATNSANVGWFVDKAGVIQISEDTDQPTIYLSDVHDEENGWHVCYTSADVAFDTAEMVNTLTLSNHDRAYTGEPVAITPPPPPASTFVGSYWWVWNVLTPNPVQMNITVEVRLSHDTRVQPRSPVYGESVTARAGRWVTITIPVPPNTDTYPSIDFDRTEMSDPGATVTLEVRNISAQTITGTQADDTTLGPFAAFASQATWGPRAADLETAIYTGHAATADNHPQILAQLILDRYRIPRPAVSEVTFNALDHLDRTAGVEVRDLADVTHRDIHETAAIIGIQHTITPKTWTTTLTLMKAN